MNLKNLKSLFIDNGCTKIYIKKLSPNDNSKNQVYFGGSFDILNILPISEIKKYVDDFIDFAISMPHLEFLVTEIGCGRAGYKPKDIAPLFERAKDITNIYLPARFWHKLK